MKSSKQSKNIEVQDKSTLGKIKETITGYGKQVLGGAKVISDDLTGYEDKSYTKTGLKSIDWKKVESDSKKYAEDPRTPTQRRAEGNRGNRGILTAKYGWYTPGKENPEFNEDGSRKRIINTQVTPGKWVTK